jgi:hypothetical protein
MAEADSSAELTLNDMPFEHLCRVYDSILQAQGKDKKEAFGNFVTFCRGFCRRPTVRVQGRVEEQIFVCMYD